MTSDSREIFRTRPWPFEGGVFPSDLGALIQRTVLDGELPALVVIHAETGEWLIGDGVTDPNPAGASEIGHIWHAIQRNSSIASLAGLRPCSQATRAAPGEPWVVGPADLLE